MGVNKFNCEGYYDPTAYEALTKIEQEAKALRAFRPVVYICSPLAGDMVKNQENARTYCRFAVEAGCVPIAPHIYFTQFMNDNDRRERDLALFMDIVLLSKMRRAVGVRRENHQRHEHRDRESKTKRSAYPLLYRKL